MDKKHFEPESNQDPNSTQETESTQETDSSGLKRYWNAPGGPRELLKIALPLMLSAGFVSLTLFTDRTLLYWHSEESASAALGAGTIYWSVICLPMGILSYISTFVSQYRGARQFSKIGSAYQHAIWLAWCFVPILLLFIVSARALFDWSGHAESLAQQETIYLRVTLLGGLGVLFYSVQSGLLTGQGRTATVLAVDGIATVVNLILDFVLIFGWGPIPELGLLGAAIATSGSFWIKLPIMHWIIRRDSTLQHDYALSQRHRFQSDTLRRLLVYGGPAGMQMVAEAGCFSVILLQVGNLGEMEMAATTLALGLNVLAFVPMIGMGIGVGVLVGQHLTEGRLDLAKKVVRSAVAITVAYTGCFAVLLAVFPSLMIAVYEWGTPDDRFEQMRPLLLPLLKVIAFYCVLDGLQIVFVGAIKGAGDTLFVLLATICVSVSALLMGLLCQEWLGPSLQLWWYVVAGWVASMGIVFGGRYLSGVWQNKRVIESEAALAS